MAGSLNSLPGWSWKTNNEFSDSARKIAQLATNLDAVFLGILFLNPNLTPSEI